ncbi:MAG: biopolymer transporter ExbD [Myxococcota bacterium]|jgi:biopolymer transport protein ExbD
MKFRNARSRELGSPLAPLLDVVLLLLIFFVVSTSFVDDQLPLDLPEARTAARGEPDAIVLTVDIGGVVTVGGVTVSAEQLRQQLEAAAAVDAELQIRADRGTEHGAVIEVLDLARQVGLDRVGIGVSRAKILGSLD